jgi:cobalt/nickel transport system permease protein
MHMADALISPAVGGVLWAASGGVTFCSAKRLKEGMDDRKVPLMGVLGAFIFAAQMINFTIPGTGASGHLGGGMILAILLGPHAAFLTMGSILTIQALFFADGGLLALGCNVFNLGFFPCFVAYPLVYRKVLGDRPTSTRIVLASMLACVVGLELGAVGVVFETVLSGLSDLPVATFVLLMLPIHLAIGLVEGIVTASVVTFIWRARPEFLEWTAVRGPGRAFSIRTVLAVLLLVALGTGGGLSWFASTHPDGLEWSLFRATGKEELPVPGKSLHAALGHLQQKTAFLPDYGFKEPDAEGSSQEETWPAVNAGTTVSGLVGMALTIGLVALIGLGLKRYHQKR